MIRDKYIQYIIYIYYIYHVILSIDIYAVYHIRIYLYKQRLQCP